MAVHESNGNGTLSNTTTAHHHKVIGARRASVIVLCTAMRAKIVVFWVLMPALRTLGHLGTSLITCITPNESRSTRMTRQGQAGGH